MTIVEWPARFLMPERCAANVKPFTRSGGPTLGGLERAVRTDRGWWTVTLENVLVDSIDRARTWEAIDSLLGGRSGMIAVPIWNFDTAPYADGVHRYGRPSYVEHSDGTRFSDGTRYQQRRIYGTMESTVSIGDTQCTIRMSYGAADMAGVRFSYHHAAYKTGPVISRDGDLWTVPITPQARAAIPAGAELEFDMPTCLCRLTSDDGMSRALNNIIHGQVSVSFVEAVDYWSDLAAGLVE